jgi:hypothetical protein
MAVTWAAASRTVSPARPREVARCRLAGTGRYRKVICCIPRRSVGSGDLWGGTLVAEGVRELSAELCVFLGESVVALGGFGQSP